MNFTHELWLGQVELVKASVEGSATAVEHRPHGAIRKDETLLFNDLEKAPTVLHVSNLV